MKARRTKDPREIARQALWDVGGPRLVDDDALNRRSEDPGYKLLTIEDLSAIPQPDPLIDGIMPVGALVSLYGAPGCGKSFLCLDWAMSIATNSPWGGREVAGGEVVYVAAEGLSGMRVRVPAWMDGRKSAAEPRIQFVPSAVPLMDHRRVGQFIERVQQDVGPLQLVVLDTLARCTPGMEENSARDMGLAIVGADLIREALGCTVLLVHHSNKSGERERGSTALLGAVDVHMKLTKKQPGLTLECEKSKESAGFRPIRFALEPRLESAAIVPSESRGASRSGLSGIERVALRSLHEMESDHGLTNKAWQTAARQPGSTFDKARKSLCDRGFVAKRGDRRGGRYSVTEVGRALLTP